MQSAGLGSTSARPSTTVCPFCGSGCSMFLSGSASFPLQHHPVGQGALCLRGKCASDAELGYELLSRFSRIMVDRIQAMSLQLMDVYGEHPVEHD